MHADEWRCTWWRAALVALVSTLAGLAWHILIAFPISLPTSGETAILFLPLQIASWLVGALYLATAFVRRKPLSSWFGLLILPFGIPITLACVVWPPPTVDLFPQVLMAVPEVLAFVIAMYGSFALPLCWLHAAALHRACVWQCQRPA